MKFPRISRLFSPGSEREDPSPEKLAEYEALAVHRRVELVGDIDDTLAQRVIAQLLFLQMSDDSQPIHLAIDSAGGSVTATLAIFDTMKFVKNPIHTSCQHEAYGGALVLLGAGRKGFRSANAHATFGLTRTVTKGGSTSVEASQWIEKIHRRLVTIVAEASGQSPEAAARSMEDHLQFSAAGLRAFGLIDRIV